MTKTTRRPKRANGEGSIWKSEKGQCWYAEVVLDDGRRPRRKARNQAEAVVKLRELLVAPPAHDSALSVADWLDHWLGEILPTSATERTVRGYKEVSRAYVVPHVGKIKLAKLGPEHIDRMMNAALRGRLLGEHPPVGSERPAPLPHRRGQAWARQGQRGGAHRRPQGHTA